MEMFPWLIFLSKLSYNGENIRIVVKKLVIKSTTFSLSIAF
jgi:hypothetical protein